jgi:hypothetical protein
MDISRTFRCSIRIAGNIIIIADTPSNYTVDPECFGLVAIKDICLENFHACV